MQKFRHWFSQAGWFNCLLFVCLLRLRGRVKKLVEHKGHWLGVTARGSLVHFKSLSGADRLTWWYWGRPHAFRRGQEGRSHAA